MDLISELACLPKMTMDHQNDHERFTRLLLEAEPVMLRSVLVMVPNRTDARDILQETAVALWRQFDSYDPQRPFVNWAMGFARIETRRFLARLEGVEVESHFYPGLYHEIFNETTREAVLGDLTNWLDAQELDS